MTSEQPGEPDPEDDREWIDIELEVGPAGDGYRLDRFLKLKFKRLSRNRIHRMIALGRVCDMETDAPYTKNSQRVRLGQRFMVHRPAPDEPDAVMDYQVLHEDEQLLVIHKPARLAVHPSARYHHHTLTALMRERLGPRHGWEMAHRIDRETSGVLIFGRRGEPARRLKRAFFRRRIDKCYLAIARGRLEGGMDIDVPLGNDESSRILIKMGRREVEDGGLEAQTRVDPIAHGEYRGEPVTLVRARPRTGRTHQIRIHLALIGHPLLGDKIYGVDEQDFLDVVERGRPVEEFEDRLGLDRHALHAAALRFPHPATGQTVEFCAPWPEQLHAIIPVPAEWTPFVSER